MAILWSYTHDRTQWCINAKERTSQNLAYRIKDSYRNDRLPYCCCCLHRIHKIYYMSKAQVCGVPKINIGTRMQQLYRQIATLNSIWITKVNIHSDYLSFHFVWRLEMIKEVGSVRHEFYLHFFFSWCQFSGGPTDILKILFAASAKPMSVGTSKSQTAWNVQ